MLKAIKKANYIRTHCGPDMRFKGYKPNQLGRRITKIRARLINRLINAPLGMKPFALKWAFCRRRLIEIYISLGRTSSQSALNLLRSAFNLA